MYFLFLELNSEKNLLCGSFPWGTLKGFVQYLHKQFCQKVLRGFHMVISHVGLQYTSQGRQGVEIQPWAMIHWIEPGMGTEWLGSGGITSEEPFQTGDRRTGDRKCTWRQESTGSRENSEEERKRRKRRLWRPCTRIMLSGNLHLGSLRTSLQAPKLWFSGCKGPSPPKVMK